VQELHTTAMRVEMTARRHGRTELGKLFQGVASAERRRVA
jgi:hypothetical protein